MVATKDVSPQNRAISGKRVFVDVVKDIKVRSSRVRVTFNTTDRVLLRDKEDTVEEPLKGRARDGREGTTSPGTPGAPEAGKGRKDPILEPLEGPQP